MKPVSAIQVLARCQAAIPCNPTAGRRRSLVFVGNLFPNLQNRQSDGKYWQYTSLGWSKTEAVLELPCEFVSFLNTEAVCTKSGSEASEDSSMRRLRPRLIPSVLEAFADILVCWTASLIKFSESLDGELFSAIDSHQATATIASWCISEIDFWYNGKQMLQRPEFKEWRNGANIYQVRAVELTCTALPANVVCLRKRGHYKLIGRQVVFRKWLIQTRKTYCSQIEGNRWFIQVPKRKPSGGDKYYKF